MRLTVFTNYALRTLMYAALKPDELSRVGEVVDAYGISRAHVMKCVQLLGQWGFLENVRGRNGGFRLARPADRISLGEVVRHTEEELNLMQCFVTADSDCPLLEVCRLSGSFRKALDAFLEVLDDITIADVTRNRPALVEKLNLPAIHPS